MILVAPESAQHSSLLEMGVKTLALGEFKRDVAKEPVDDVTDDVTEELSDVSQLWTAGGKLAAC